MPDPQPKAFETILGKILITWNDAHYHIFQIFKAMLQKTDDEAEAIFYSLDSDRLQRNMTKALARVVITHDKPLLTAIIATVTGLDDLSAMRNAFIHSIWPGDLSGNLKPKTPKNNKFSGMAVRSEADRILHETARLGLEAENLADVVAMQVPAKAARETLAPLLKRISPNLPPTHMRQRKKAKNRRNGPKGNPQ